MTRSYRKRLLWGDRLDENAPSMTTAVIEKVLESSGNVFLTRSGSLKKFERIALILRGEEYVR